MVQVDCAPICRLLEVKNTEEGKNRVHRKYHRKLHFENKNVSDNMWQLMEVEAAM